MSQSPHPTTRRGVIATVGFGGVSLYGLWVAYGAAPGPLALLAPADSVSGASNGSGGHGGHGAAPAGSPTESFRRSAAEFVERYRMADGSVYPRRLAGEPMADMAHAGHTMPAAPSEAAHGEGHGGAAAPAMTAPIDVYLLAEKWFYEPSDLRVDVGVPYRLRMLAADVSHGASIQFGRGARMIRLRPDTVTDMDVSFTRSGRYLVYCTVYCGQAHHQMQARIDVV
jgi:hypothetical protein